MSQKKLSQLKEGEKAIIKSIGDIQELKERLLELGALSNSTIKLEKIAPFGDPMEFRLGNTSFAIRKSEADKIIVERFKDRV